MPLSPMDEFLAHQTCETFDHVFTSDRNFYDRYYFNMHPLGDELFFIFGIGQYPNLGTTDAFISISHGDDIHVVRASRELGSNRMDTRVGPMAVEVVEGLKKLRVTCEANEWGIAKTDLAIVKGAASRRKVIEIDGDAATVGPKLTAWIKNLTKE